MESPVSSQLGIFKCVKFKTFKLSLVAVVVELVNLSHADLIEETNLAELDLIPIYEDIEYREENNSEPFERNCTAPTIDEFPSDIFTQEERQHGCVLIHLLVTFYVFYAFAIVCGDYFVPSVQRLSAELQLESDIAGATLMGIATSSPELFTNVVGIFVMEGDMGVGTIVGSAVFNHLAICACIGFATKQAVQVDWWPVTRDVIFYAISVIALLIILYDEKIYWYESTALLLLYALYIYGMYRDAAMQSWGEKFCLRSTSGKKRTSRAFSKSAESSAKDMSASQATIVTISESIFSIEEKYEMAVKAYELPKSERKLVWLEWILSWPARACLSLTIPDCRKGHLQRWYPLTFIMSTLWICALSYLASWMMTVVGHTFQIPDTVFGVSIIAAGTSVPEAVSSVIVARKGLGSMALSNAVGSNTFNILVCLGLPWLIRAMLNINLPNNYAKINSIALEYSTGMLILSIGLMYFILACNKFHIDKKVGVIATCLYICFLTFDSLVELDILVHVNVPICQA